MNSKKTFFVFLVMMLFAGINTAFGATISVSTTTDELNTNGLCSLREAITNINDGSTTYSDCAPTGSYGTGDSINIPAGAYTASSNYSVANNVSIAGDGAGTTIISASGSGDRVFVIGAYTVSISGVTITGANIWSGGGNGGAGIHNSGTLTITNSTVSNNVVNGDGTGGGGILNNGTLTITSSTISGNTATGWWANGGGGIFNYGMLTIINSTLSNNNATGKYNSGGGGILNNGTLTITSSTITDNTETAWWGSNGGGILNYGTATLSNTIVANQAEGADCEGSITSVGYNLESGTSCGFTSTGDVQNTDPLLDLLQDNGGPTFTHALLDGSPAINIISNGVNGCGTTIIKDQRGLPRPQLSNGLCDIGAFEVASCISPPSGMVSWWKAEDNADDSIGSNNGTMMNGATYATGKVGEAFSFDGVNDYLTASANDLPLGNSPRTITAWINPVTGTNTWGGIFHYGQGDCNGRMFGLGMQGGYLQFWGGCSDFGFDQSLPQNQWTFIAAVFDGSQITLWMNGQSRTTLKSLNTQNSNLWIGGETVNNGSSFRSYYQGLIDEVNIYNRALTAGEIASIHNAGSAGICEVDTDPDQFTFTDQTDVELHTSVESNTITVSGITDETIISITDCTGTNCEYSINGGDWTSTDGTVNNGDTVQVRQTSSWSYSATTDLTLNIGTVFDVFSVTTIEVPEGPLPDLTGNWDGTFKEKCKTTTEGLICRVKGKLILRNIGEADAPNIKIRFYFSEDGSYGEGDMLLEEGTKDGVLVGKAYKKSFKLILPVGISLADGYIIVYIDADNIAVESDESNNFVVYGEDE